VCRQIALKRATVGKSAQSVGPVLFLWQAIVNILWAQRIRELAALHGLASRFIGSGILIGSEELMASVRTAQ
jgi:hypothetical protein